MTLKVYKRGGFNSKLVRLEVANRLLGWDNAVLFQFQTGAIRSETEIEIKSHGLVSIPNWCD